MAKAIQILFKVLFFVTPLIFLPFTSELFEFNKTVFLYLITISITSFWILEMLLTKKLIFRKTLLDIPLLLFLLSQILATIFSIDIHTSIFGYYSRFNGSLLSTICYALLYWSYVAYIDKNENGKNIRLLMLSGVVVSLYAILEHFGYSISCLIIQGNLNAECFVQDVQSRVFATLGQPNWLASWIVALSPISWYIWLKKTDIYYSLVPVFFFLALLFTKSRSGLLAFAVVFATYWIFLLVQKKHIKKFFVLSVVFLIIFFANQRNQLPTNEPTNEITINEGGTESGEIRQIVWSGAIQLIKHNPVFGTGVETFAYSYYNYRPSEHNDTSEWDHVYNKAHNEFLNIGSNSGLVGLASYLILIGAALSQIAKGTSTLFRIALASSFITLIITNFFGFSVVVTSILFYLLPAIAISSNNKIQSVKYISSKTILIPFLFILGIVYFFNIRYWLADVFFAAGKSKVYENPQEATRLIKSAIGLSPHEAVYWNELGVALSQTDPKGAVFASNKAYELSPLNVTLLKSRNNIFTDLAATEPEYLHRSIEVLTELQKLAPTDPSVLYQLGLTYANLGDYPTGHSYIEDAIRLKKDYKNARMAASLIAIEIKDYHTARKHLEYVLQFIAPDDEFAVKQLEKVKQQEKRP